MSCYIRCLQDNTEVPVTGEDGLLSLKIGLAAKKSIKENKPVKISEIK